MSWKRRSTRGVKNCADERMKTMPKYMDMSDPSVQQMLDDDRAERLAHIRARKVAEHNCDEVPWDHETTDGPLGDAYSCSICGALMQVG